MRGGPARQPGAGNVQSTPPFQQGDGTTAPAVVGAPPAPAIPPGHHSPLSAFGRPNFQPGALPAPIVIAVPLGQANDANPTPGVLLGSGPPISAGSASGTGPGILLQESPAVGTGSGTDPTPIDDIAVSVPLGIAGDANPRPSLTLSSASGGGGRVGHLDSRRVVVNRPPWLDHPNRTVKIPVGSARASGRLAIVNIDESLRPFVEDDELLVGAF